MRGVAFVSAGIAFVSAGIAFVSAGIAFVSADTNTNLVAMHAKGTKSSH